MQMLFLGTGTSHGIPVIGCDCPVCTSSDKKDKRHRSSVYITTNTQKHILIDIGPEFRIQCIENNIKEVDSVLLTHSHADHLHGIDDLRIFACDMWKKPENPKALEQYNHPAIPVFANPGTVKDVQSRFGYFFTPSKEGGGHAKVELKTAQEQFELDGITVTPIPMLHGHLQTYGWLLTQGTGEQKTSIAYLTDCSYISPESFELINKNCGTLVHLVIDGLREKPHSTHFSFLQALEAASQVNPQNIWFTHLTHNHSHQQVQEYLDQHKKDFPSLAQVKKISPAYDQLVIEC